MLQDQLNRLKVTTVMFLIYLLCDVCKVDCFCLCYQFEEGTLKSMINAQTEEDASEAPAPEVNAQNDNNIYSIP